MGPARDQLSDYEHRVLDTVEQHPKGITFEQLCVETTLSPDILSHITHVLVQRRLVRVNEESAETEVQFEVPAVAS